MSADTSGDAALAAQLAQMDMAGSEAPGARPQQQQQPRQRQPVHLSPEQLTKLRTDVGIVQKNATVFAEMLAEQAEPAATPEPDVQLLRDLASTNQQMQARMLELIGYLGAVIGSGGGGAGPASGGSSDGSDSPGQLLEDLLRLNDQLNDSLRRFDRLQRAWPEPAADRGSFNPMFDLGESTAPRPPPAAHPPPAARPPASDPPAPPPPQPQPDFHLPPVAAGGAAAEQQPQSGNPGGLPDSEKELAEMEAWMGRGGAGQFPDGGGK